MKRLFLLTAVIAMLCLAGIAQAAVDWNGVTWIPDNNVGGEGHSSVAVNGSNLEVSTVDLYCANAYYITSEPFQSAATPWMEATFIDSGTGAGACLSMDTHDDWTAIGVSNYVSTTNYVLSWLNDYSSGDVILGARTAGSHTVKLGRRADGTWDYWFDGSLAYSASDFAPVRPVADIFLGVDAWNGSRYTNGGATAVYTNYSSGIDYAVPETSSIIALLAGFGSLVALRRRRV